MSSRSFTQAYVSAHNLLFGFDMKMYARIGGSSSSPSPPSSSSISNAIYAKDLRSRCHTDGAGERERELVMKGIYNIKTINTTCAHVSITVISISRGICIKQIILYTIASDLFYFASLRVNCLFWCVVENEPIFWMEFSFSSTWQLGPKSFYLLPNT